MHRCQQSFKKFPSDLWVVHVGSNSFWEISCAGKPQVVSRYILSNLWEILSSFCDNKPVLNDVLWSLSRNAWTHWSYHIFSILDTYSLISNHRYVGAVWRPKVWSHSTKINHISGMCQLPKPPRPTRGHCHQIFYVCNLLMFIKS